MRFKPILFSTEMVRAILEGRKTQTRRIIKPQPVDVGTMPIRASFGHYLPDDFEWPTKRPGVTIVSNKRKGPDNYVEKMAPWKVGDVLWVRETWGILQPTHATPGGRPYDGAYYFRADGDESPHWTEGTFEWSGWKPSIHMPKSACRIFLQITDIRVERLQDISEEDAKAEGVLLHERGKHWLNYQDRKAAVTQFVYSCDTAKKSFQTLWDMINGWHSFDENHWVWAISFARIDKPEGFV